MPCVGSDPRVAGDSTGATCGFALACGVLDASVISRSVRCAQEPRSIVTSRTIGAKATIDARRVNDPGAPGSFSEYLPSSPVDLASTTRPSASTSVTTTPGSGDPDAVMA